MCHSVDLRPLVGPVPGKEGLFISAGYNGASSWVYKWEARCLPSEAVAGGMTTSPELVHRPSELTPGHGMATSMNITRCLAQQLVTGQRDSRLPRCFDITQERLDKAASHCLPLM